MVKYLVAWYPFRAESTPVLTFAMGNVPLDQISLISMVVQTFLFGIFTAMFGEALRPILSRNVIEKKSVSLVLPTVSVIWLFALAHWIIDIIRLQLAFLGPHPDPVAFLSDLSTATEVSKIGMNVTVTLVADCFMVGGRNLWSSKPTEPLLQIYRCWVVAHKSFLVIIVPTALWLAAGVSGSVATRLLFQLHTDREGFHDNLSPWFTTFFTSTLAANAFCTLYIAYRVLRSQLAVRGSQRLQSPVFCVVIIFLESAALYSIALVALLITFQADTNGQFVIVDSICALIGITFSMIILPTLSRSQSQVSGSRSTRPVPRMPAEGVTVSRLVEVVSDDYEMNSLPSCKHVGVA
ncbi:unnamed protein product [Mycena citricolor]|uniref:Uncharacterized protein n=1 Tax=Mycena citricolor TaxID=2018698 RepID=A0AAD2H8Z4_9AGAR|nr:unnamed protein product [Mycena citricolor]